jgi:hypothetical protein
MFQFFPEFFDLAIRLPTAGINMRGATRFLRCAGVHSAERRIPATTTESSGDEVGNPPKTQRYNEFMESVIPDDPNP